MIFFLPSDPSLFALEAVGEAVEAVVIAGVADDPGQSIMSFTIEYVLSADKCEKNCGRRHQKSWRHVIIIANLVAY